MAGVRSRVVILEPDPAIGRAMVRLLREVMPHALVSTMGIQALQASAQDLTLIIAAPEVRAEEFGRVYEGQSSGGAVTPVIKVFASQNAGDIAEWAKVGAAGFVLASVRRAEMRLAIETVLAGGGYVSVPLLPAFSAGERDKALDLAMLMLTPREQEVLCHIALNMSNKDIARRLGLSVRTIETHRLHIRRKTGAGSRLALVQLAERLGLLSQYPIRHGAAPQPVPRGLHEDE